MARLVQRSGAVYAQTLSAIGISIHAPVVAVNAEAASYNPVVPGGPREPNTRKEDIMNRLLNRTPPIVWRKPHRPRRIGNGIDNCRIEGADPIRDFVPSTLNLVPQSEVQR